MRTLLAAGLAACLVSCGPSEAKKTLCASNLKSLWMLQQAAAKGKAMSRATGRSFWLETQSAEDLDAYVCPLSDRKPGKGVTTYRGPKADVNRLKLSDMVGACAGIHSDGSVTALRKDGSVVVLKKTDAEAAEARSSTAE